MKAPSFPPVLALEARADDLLLQGGSGHIEVDDRQRRAPDDLLNLLEIDSVIRDDLESGARLQFPSKKLDAIGLDEAALTMAGLGPRVREIDMSGVQALVFEIVADESNRVREHDAHVLAGVAPAPVLGEAPLEARIFDTEEVDLGSDLRFRYEESAFPRADLELERSLVPEEGRARGGLFDVLELEPRDFGT